MTEKQQQALDYIITALPEDWRESYREIAQYAISLGYMPSIKGVRKDSADFTKSRVRRTIMKIATDPKFRGLGIKFYALPDYTGIFKGAIDMRLEYWDKLGYEARCFGCGKCDGTVGYSCTLADGSEGFLCGFGVMPLPNFSIEHVPALKAALKIQDDYFMRERERMQRG